MDKRAALRAYMAVDGPAAPKRDRTPVKTRRKPRKPPATARRLGSEPYRDWQPSRHFPENH